MKAIREKEREIGKGRERTSYTQRHDRSSHTHSPSPPGAPTVHHPPNHRLGGRFRGERIIVTVVSTSSGSTTSSSTTTSTEVVFGMCVVEDELTMFGVGEATRRVLEGGGGVAAEAQAVPAPGGDGDLAEVSADQSAMRDQL